MSKIITVVMLILIGSSGFAADRYTRSEAQCRFELSETARGLAERIAPKGISESDLWFIEREIIAINGCEEFAAGDCATYPIYKSFQGSHVCSDMRNWHVAVLKGRKYDVCPGLLLGIRSHENPKKSRDHYAYGVVVKKGTDLWTQADWGAKIVDRICRQKGIDACHPSRGDLYRLALVYVGMGSSSANHWADCVHAMRLRAID